MCERLHSIRNIICSEGWLLNTTGITEKTTRFIRSRGNLKRDLNVLVWVPSMSIPYFFLKVSSFKICLLFRSIIMQKIGTDSRKTYKEIC